ncbi:acid shock protein [Clostridium sp. C2-6-12]|uniref:acid shock protein n=1 Tax=Clostridium sp. C2-6-12 TaxID=2698832 RepID=UPI0013695B84|nr:acid shock protein [Clostridium sp. C2-6-12]
MKKIILGVIATSMLLTNVAFASTQTTQARNTKNSTTLSVDSNNVYHLNTQDPNSVYQLNTQDPN